MERSSASGARSSLSGRTSSPDAGRDGIIVKENTSGKWYRYLVAGLFLLQAAVFLIYREERYPQIHDNLDLFMAHYQMMKVNGIFVSHGVDAPMLHGISRDLLGSEFLLYNLLYVLLPGFWAYLAGYALKILIGFVSFTLLSKDILGERYDRYRPVVIVTAAAFGMIPVFPTYGIAFTSVPLLVLILKNLYEERIFRMRLPLYLFIFLYPVLSYFSYHGFFILCYMCAAVIILWIRDRHFPKSLFAAICVLSAGYMAFEYRLFGAMLFDDTVTIRTTMDHGELTLAEALRTGFSEFIRASFHSEDSHTWVILPVVLVAFIVINLRHIIKLHPLRIFKEPLNGILIWIVFNCLIFGLYQHEPFRKLVETLVPKLTGFEFARFAYFNTFLWYAAFLLVCIRMYHTGKKVLIFLANLLAAAALIAVMFAPAMYNDFYYTCYNQAYKLLLHKETSTVNYREFYSEKLFDLVKEDIGYDGEWSVSYGMHPAVLQYNGIATLDGYLGMYPQSYKDTWENVIEPAFPGSPSLEAYFRSWGARVNLISASDENTYAPLRVFTLKDERLVADMNWLKALDCTWIFSRIAFSNADEQGLTLANTYTDSSSPYTIYVYRVQDD